jgi:hypothetical protein
MQLYLGSKVIKINAVFNDCMGLLAGSSSMIPPSIPLNTDECTNGIREHKYLVSNLRVRIFHCIT